MVEIKGIAREPGMRSKVAVSAAQANLDPVGACVGMRGGRIQAIVHELHDEKIDVIEWNSDQAAFIAKALSPARTAGVYLDEDPVRGRTALVVVSEDQLSLAIGREGVNARLAAKLTGWRVDIKSVAEATADAVQKLSKEEVLAPLAESNASLIAQVQDALARKAEGRPLPPEDYNAMTQFVTLVEKTLSDQRDTRRKAQTKRLVEIRKSIPKQAYAAGLEALALPEAVSAALTNSGVESIGQAYERILLDADSVLALPEIGAHHFDQIKSALESQIAGMKLADTEKARQEELLAQEKAAAEGAALPAADQESIADGAALAEGALVESEAPAETGDIAVPVVAGEEESEEEDSDGAGGKKKKKGKVKAVIEYDPELGMTVTRRKRKRVGGKDWVDGNTSE
jgi:transcription termination/antitermination protein NusA